MDERAVGLALADLPPGPVAIVWCENGILVRETLNWNRNLGFAAHVMIGAGLSRDLSSAPDLVIIDQPVAGRREAAAIFNRLSGALTGRWVLHGFNSEFAVFPYFEHRSVRDFLAFIESEQRRSVYTYVLDLYSDSMCHGGAPDRDDCAFDALSYYGYATDGDAKDVFGGLGWRFEEHTNVERLKINRIALFRATEGVEMTDDFMLSDPEMNTISCPWHHNPTMALMSFRVARSLTYNPLSANAIDRLTWRGSRKFGWTSMELMEDGFIEPGQWV